MSFISTIMCIVLLISINLLFKKKKKCRTVCINGQRYVCCIECNVVSNECNESTPVLCNLSARTVVKLCNLGVFCSRIELGFLNCELHVCYE